MFPRRSMWTTKLLGPIGRCGRAGGLLMPPGAVLPCIPFFLCPGHQVGKDQDFRNVDNHCHEQVITQVNIQGRSNQVEKNQVAFKLKSIKFVSKASRIEPVSVIQCLDLIASSGYARPFDRMPVGYTLGHSLCRVVSGDLQFHVHLFVITRCTLGAHADHSRYARLIRSGIHSFIGMRLRNGRMPPAFFLQNMLKVDSLLSEVHTHTQRTPRNRRQQILNGACRPRRGDVATATPQQSLDSHLPVLPYNLLDRCECWLSTCPGTPYPTHLSCRQLHNTASTLAHATTQKALFTPVPEDRSPARTLTSGIGYVRAPRHQFRNKKHDQARILEYSNPDDFACTPVGLGRCSRPAQPYAASRNARSRTWPTCEQSSRLAEPQGPSCFAAACKKN